MKRAAVLLALSAMVFLASCTGTAQLTTQPAVVEQPVPPEAVPAQQQDRTYRETGTASWYGADLHGRPTAGGETFDMNGVTAAHRTLPLGTAIRVTNLDNYKAIDVRITDRGPFVRSRVLELSYGAARSLDFVRAGTARVTIEAIEPVRGDGVFTVQAAAFVEEEQAKTLKGRLQMKYETVFIVPGETNLGKFYRVRVGMYPTEEKAGRIAAKLALDGLEPVVVRKD